ncbi:DNA polymerase III subunit beta [Fibrella sp. ES10-3-2-2]|nr:DNA polymerase III subunit beta [Fibrella sp. ES10-3-2-2]
MKFIVSSSVLLKNLMTINGVIATNPIVPILENFLFRIHDQVLTITASDLQTTMITQLPVDTSDSGAIAVPAKLLLDTLRSLPEQPITVKVSDTWSVTIMTDNGKFKLSGENPVDFPKIPEVANDQAFTLESDALLRAIGYTAFATSTDDLRPAMTGVLVQLGTGATFVATTGHILVRYRQTITVEGLKSASIILPRKPVAMLKTSLPEGVPVQVVLSKANASFSFGPTKLICRLIDERFPDYENAIPTDNSNVLTIGRADLLNSLKRIMIYANRTTHQIRLSVKANSLAISAEDLDYSNEADEKLLCEYDGDEMDIGFNAKILSDALSHMDAKIVRLEMSAPNKAALVFPVDEEEGESILMLVMPVMLNTYA